MKIKKLIGDKIVATLLEDQFPCNLIIVPEIANPTSNGLKARVLFVGSSFRFKNEIDVGDVVIVKKYIGDPLTKFDDKTRVFHGEDVIAVCQFQTS